MDKDNNKQKNTTKRFPVFYIALCCCVLTVGAMGFINDRRQSERANSTAKNVLDSTPQAELPVVSSSAPLIADNSALKSDVSLEEEKEESVFESSDTPSINTAPTAEPTLEQDYTYNNPDLAVSVTKTDQTPLPQFQAPINGAILAGYSEELEYSNVFSDYRAHCGVDVGAQVGASVVCAADGTVKSITDTVFGDVVTVTHSDGYETVYSQLCVSDTLKENVQIKSGDVLGTLAQPQGENISDAHLHFEMYRDGASLDPSSLISFK